MIEPRCHLDVETFSFAHRIFDIWNGIDKSIIACDSIDRVKNRIKKCVHGRGLI